MKKSEPILDDRRIVTPPPKHDAQDVVGSEGGAATNLPPEADEKDERDRADDERSR